MFFASYGPPPEKTADFRLKSLRQFVDLQGTDPKKWVVQPFCPHCKIPVDDWNIKAALGFRAASVEVAGEHHRKRRSPGFGHKAGTALPDCPWNFADDPRYKGEDAPRKTSIVSLNRQILNDPRMLQATQDILSFLLRPVTGEKVLSEQNRQMLKAVSANAISMPGLSVYPYLYAPMQAMLFGSRYRTFGRSESAEIEAVPAEQHSLIEMPDAAQKNPRRKPVREVVYENIGSQLLEFEIDGKPRVDIVPQALRLCFVYRGDGDVKHVPILSGPEKHRVEFPLTREFLHKVAKDALEARKKLAQRAELTAKLPGYDGGKPHPGLPVAPGQLDFL